MTTTIDIEIVLEGSVTGFRGVSDRGKSWMAENISAEDWQMLGGCLWCDSRAARDVIAGAINEGMNVSEA